MPRPIVFPWDKVGIGQSLFVPCLDFEAVRRQGLASALPYRYHIHAIYGVKHGRAGVLFIRTAPRLPVSAGRAGSAAS